MILKLEQHTSQKDIEVIIKYPVKNKTVERIVSLVKSVDMQIECYSDDILKMVNVSDIYYIESIDKKTVVFCEKESYQNKNRLYQIYDKLSDNGFVQISKYCILNINKLEKIKPLANSHLEAVLSNGKCLYVTRKYLAGIQRILQEDEKDG
jgi:DNA-binding LytR/AlgR family response regulator